MDIFMTFDFDYFFAGDYLITKQTGKEGRICNSVMITERKYTRKEYYLAFSHERAFKVRVLGSATFRSFDLHLHPGARSHRVRPRRRQH